MNQKLFIDLDGVLGDTLGYASLLFGGEWGFESNFKELIPKINEYGRFYLDQPLMPDAMLLWGSLQYLNPIILTGIHSDIPNMTEQKKQWVWNHFGGDAQVICCKSQDKHKHGRPGDILIDDRIRYSHLWIDMGGFFIHHRSATESIAHLAHIYALMAANRP